MAAQEAPQAGKKTFFKRRKTCPFSGPNSPAIDWKDVRMALVSGRPDDDTRSYLARMNMLDERGVKQRLLRRMLASAVREALRHRPDNGA